MKESNNTATMDNKTFALIMFVLIITATLFINSIFLFTMYKRADRIERAVGMTTGKVGNYQISRQNKYTIVFNRALIDSYAYELKQSENDHKKLKNEFYDFVEFISKTEGPYKSKALQMLKVFNKDTTASSVDRKFTPEEKAQKTMLLYRADEVFGGKK